MKRLTYIVASGIILTLIECILLALFFSIEDSVLNDIPLLKHFSDSIREAGEVIAVRAIFYSAIWIAAVYVFFKSEKIEYSVLRFAVLNCGLYLSTSILMGLIMPDTIEFFSRSFFYFLTAATLISPFVMSRLPNVDKIIKGMQ